MGSYLEGKLKVSSVKSVGPFLLRVASPDNEAIYDLTGELGWEAGLAWAEAPTEPPSEEELIEWYTYTPAVGLIGTDGSYYGIGLYYSEPASCPRDNGFLVAGDTGEVLACGWGGGDRQHGSAGLPMGGAAFVLPEGSQGMLERFAVPQPVSADQCNPFDLDALPAAPISTESPRG